MANKFTLRKSIADRSSQNVDVDHHFLAFNMELIQRIRVSILEKRLGSLGLGNGSKFVCWWICFRLISGNVVCEFWLKFIAFWICPHRSLLAGELGSLAMDADFLRVVIDELTKGLSEGANSTLTLFKFFAYRETLPRWWYLISRFFFAQVT